MTRVGSQHHKKKKIKMLKVTDTRKPSIALQIAVMIKCIV